VSRSGRVLVLAVLLCSLAIVAMVGAGCRSTPLVVEVTDRDDGSTQQLGMDQQLQITLESNQTTGYSWALDGRVPDQLLQSGEAEYVGSQSNRVGAGGKEIWLFKPTQAGEGTLKLKYWRPFEPDEPPAETFSVTVDVQ